MKAGVRGVHLPVRMGDLPDDEFMAMVKDYSAKKQRTYVVQSRRRVGRPRLRRKNGTIRC